MFFALKLQVQQLSAQREELALQRAELQATRIEIAKTAEANIHVATLAKKNLRAQYLQSWLASRSQTKVAYENAEEYWDGRERSYKVGDIFISEDKYDTFFELYESHEDELDELTCDTE